MPVIFNPEPRFVILHAPQAKEEQPNDDRMHTVKLLPGINDVADGEWNKVKDHPAVKKFFEAGVLEMIELKNITQTLEGTQPRQAFDMIKKCVDLDMLKRWRGAEARAKDKRSAVVKAIDEQVKALTE